ncbi:MAG TPA: redoxin domain-containing protein [Thermoanaerobaculia bacterium]|nr:redoxin domain-containing protein [Thermoanaerobaculia bacterium]
MTQRHRLLFLLLLAPLALPAQGQAPPPPAWQETLDEGKDLLQESKPSEAVKAFRQADKMAGGSCVECQLGLAAAFNQLSAFKETLKSTDAVLKLTAETADLIRAHHLRGLALYALAGDDMAKLKQAEESFRRVLELSRGEANTARFNLGLTLLKQSRDAEGVAVLKEYVEKEPDAKDAKVALGFIENPLRSRKRIVPDFELATLQGEYFTAEDLKGKVILLDFWGTWCAPCVEAVPSLRTLSRRMKDDPFVLLSISTDQDEAVLREFIAKNKMDWPQVWDKDHDFSDECQISHYPSYLLVSHEGEIVYLTSGWGEGIERDLLQKVAGAVRAAKKSAKAK